MFTSIRKITASVLSKVLIVIIILPFLFWGMGDVFRGGNQNILVTIDSEKMSTQRFVEYVNRIGLSEKQRKNLSKTDLLDKILSDYIGKKIIILEIEDQGISLSDRSLKKIITTDKTFLEDNKFSRTKYEKFLLESGLSAPTFEQNIAEQEKKRQLLTFLSEGVVVPEALVKKEFESENQIKTIQYLDLNELYKKNLIKDEDIKKTYEANKQFFLQEFKKINYVELSPNNIIGQNEYNKAYFEKIDEIENAILDGVKITNFIKKFNLSIITISETNRQKKDKKNKDIDKIDDKLFLELFSMLDVNKPRLININNKYYLSEVKAIEEISRTLDDVEIKEAIVAQLKIKNIIESNSAIVKKMSEKKFKKDQFNKFGKDNNINIKKIILRDIKDETVFKEGIIKEIFKVRDGDLQLITDSNLTKNYIIFSENTEMLPFDKKIKDYQKYKSRAKMNFANQIYGTFDKAINNKYNVEVNKKVLNRIKNTL